jgi:putative flippase GtrA
MRLIPTFLGVGGAGAATYALLATGLDQAGLPAWLASVLSYAALIPIVYWGQRRLTFRSSAPHASAFPKYVGAQMLGLSLSAALPWFLPPAPRLPPALTFFAMIGVISALNFILLKFWTFARRPEP